jgi:hypothetical protein
MSTDSSWSFTRLIISERMLFGSEAFLAAEGGAIEEGKGPDDDSSPISWFGVFAPPMSRPIEPLGASQNLVEVRSLSSASRSPFSESSQSWRVKSFCSIVVCAATCKPEDFLFVSSSRMSPSQGVFGSSSDRKEGKVSGLMIDNPMPFPGLEERGGGLVLRTAAVFIFVRAWTPLCRSMGEADPDKN